MTTPQKISAVWLWFLFVAFLAFFWPYSVYIVVVVTLFLGTIVAFLVLIDEKDEWG